MAFAVLPVALLAIATPAAWAATGSGPGDDTAALPATYVAARHLPPGTIATVRAGSLRTGTAEGANWAIADFTPASSDSATVQTAFQDGASAAVFRQVPGEAWRLVQAGPYGCGSGLPASLVTSFGLASPPACHTSQTADISAARRAPRGTDTIGQKIAGIALSQIGVGVTPAMPDFGTVDCDPYSTLVGAQSPNADGCGLNADFKIENQNEAWCSDFAKWVWQQAGVTVDMNTLNAGSVSFYDWGLDQKQNVTPDTGTPAVGDAVVFFPPGTLTPTTYADHVGIVTGINSDGTINMANGDFSGGPDIDVQYDTEISLTSWASSIWNQGEQWVLISPPGTAQQPAPAVSMTGPSRAVAGTSVRFTASAAGATQYLWTFGDGRADNVPGASVSHVYAENGTYPVTVSVTSSLGTVTTKAMNVTVTGASSAVAEVPVNQLWYSPTPVDRYLFLRSSSGGLAAETWDGAGWLQHTVPGTPDSASGVGGADGITALSYPDPAVSDAMTPHAYYSSGGTLTQTYLGGSGWASAVLAGHPASGSAIVADSAAAGPEVFYFGTGGRLAESSESSVQGGGWTVSAVGGPAAASLGSLALADTAGGPELFYLGGPGHGSLTMAFPAAAGGGWRTTRVPTPQGIAADSPLAAVSTGPFQAGVFFIDGHGKLTEAMREGPGWAVVPVPGAPAAATALAAVRYLTGPQSTAGAVTGTGTEVLTLTRSGQPSVSYTAAGGWKAAALPGTGSGILAADAYQNAGEPSQLFLSGPLSVDQAGTPGGSWSSAALPATPATLADSVVLYAATSSDDATALAAATAAGLPASQVTTSFATAWADTLNGDHLVISVGLAATDALDYNVCGWANPSGEIAGSTPFYIVGGPLNTLPGPDAYEEAAAAQTPALATDLAYYATHGTLPQGVTTLPSAAKPVYACSGSAGS
jgi:hypothetical protein